MQPVFLSPLVLKLTDLDKISVLAMLQHLLNSYREWTKSTSRKTQWKWWGLMTPRNLYPVWSRNWKKEEKLVHAGGHKIANAMMVSKGVTILEQTATFNKDIREWRQQKKDLKTWATFKTISYQAHREEIRVVTTAEKGEYTAGLQKSMVYHHPLQKSITRR